MTMNSDCACGTTERAWMRRFSPATVSRDTMVCAGCANEPNLSKVSWRCGAKSMRERKWNCAFLAAPPIRQIANVSGCCKNLPERRRHKVMSAGISQIRILTVDDHPVVREGIAGLLAVQPDMSLVGEASNGREAIQQFRAHRPDVTLMDLQM